MRPGALRRLLGTALLLVLFSTGILLAQIDTGGITGTVHDKSGAVVVGAKVALTNDSTGIMATAASTSTGTYVFDAVKPGTYTVTTDAHGFETYINHGVIVHVQQIVTIDVPLVPGSVSQHVTVTAAAPLLQTENAALGQTVDSKTVNDLPLNEIGRAHV